MAVESHDRDLKDLLTQLRRQENAVPTGTAHPPGVKEVKGS